MEKLRIAHEVIGRSPVDGELQSEGRRSLVGVRYGQQIADRKPVIFRLPTPVYAVLRELSETRGQSMTAVAAELIARGAREELERDQTASTT